MWLNLERNTIKGCDKLIDNVRSDTQKCSIFFRSERSL